jgi:CRP/FNR family transcriptional regulator
MIVELTKAHYHMTGQDRLSATAIDEAIAKSMLAAFPPTLRKTLTQEAIPVDLPAGTTLYYEGDEPRCGLVITGLVRVYMTSPDGRQITVRYARTGDLLGIAAIVGGPAPVSVQILTDAALLMLNVRTLQMSGQTEPKVGWLMAQEVTRRLYDTLEALAGNAFGSLQQRLARHLLDLAASGQQGRGLVAKVTQQELADAVGSVRPVVARIMRELRVEGIITTSSDGIVVLKPVELHAKTWSRDV